MPSTSLVLTIDQRSDLEARVRSGRGRADAARRARVILLLAEGRSYAAIATMTGCSSRTIALWKQRFAKDGLAGLDQRGDQLRKLRGHGTLLSPAGRRHGVGLELELPVPARDDHPARSFYIQASICDSRQPAHFQKKIHPFRAKIPPFRTTRLNSCSASRHGPMRCITCTTRTASK